MEEIDLDGVADFIYMAALLISIKVRMLLPRPEVDEEGEPIDPRRELVERLLEYIRYKEASEELTVLHDKRKDLFTRGEAASVKEQFHEDEPETFVNTTLFDLVSALRRVLTEVPEIPTLQVPALDFTIEEQRAYVLQELNRRGKLPFIELARHWHKGFIITTFLAILEMAQRGVVLLSPTETTEDFYVERVPNHDAMHLTNGTGVS
jgi:segregation and condensation protein A